MLNRALATVSIVAILGLSACTPGTAVTVTHTVTSTTTVTLPPGPTSPATTPTTPGPSPIREDVTVKVGQTTTIGLGRSHGSVGIYQAIDVPPDATIATAKITSELNNTSQTPLPPGGDNGTTTLHITGVAPGTTTLTASEHFRGPRDTTKPERIITIHVVK